MEFYLAHSEDPNKIKYTEDKRTKMRELVLCLVIAEADPDKKVADQVPNELNHKQVVTEDRSCVWIYRSQQHLPVFIAKV